MNDVSENNRYSQYALAVLRAVNLLNYLDRQALDAVSPLIKADLWRVVE